MYAGTTAGMRRKGAGAPFMFALEDRRSLIHNTTTAFGRVV
jgi:hypothetical protein